MAVGEIKTLTYVEIDIKYCANTYGTAPCTAALTGDSKCFNTRNFVSDCQDTANFTDGTKTLRFGIDNGFLPEDIECIPSLVSVSVTDARVMPGQSIGERATLSATFKNHRSGDAGLDKYISDRTYDPFEQGTFWGKFKARNPYTRYRACRLIRGKVGQTLAQMETEHFVIDSINGPGSDGRVTLKAVDFMRLLEAETSQAPAANKGYLSANITNVATSLTLNPVGIGNANYPASGKAAIGEEIVSFTRSGDVLTITRGQEGTTAAAHEADDVVQVILQYTSQTVAYIIDDLIVNYTPLDSSYTDLTDWNTKVTNFSDVLYSTIIAKPTPVVTLINELIEQAGLIVFGDNKNQQVFFDFIRNTTASTDTIDDARIVKDTFRHAEQPKLRYSQIWFFYYRRDVFKNLNDSGNYYSGVVDVVSDNQYETESIKRIYSRWVPGGGRSIAEDVAGRIKARYLNPPRQFMFKMFGSQNIALGNTLPLTHWSLEDAHGLQATTDVTITGLKSTDEGYTVTAEEITFDTSGITGDKIINFDTDSTNVNLRTIYDSLFASVDEVNDIIFIVSSGIKIGSTTNSSFAMVTGTWPAGATLYLINNGHIVGKGGGGSSSPNTKASDGGDALNVTKALDIDNTNGTIGGGGGGGAGGYQSIPAPPYTIEVPGGGGAGYTIGAGGSGSSSPDADDGTLETGGQGYATGGDGGDLGTDGTVGTGANPANKGLAGVAVDGDSLVTWTALGTISGSRIN